MKGKFITLVLTLGFLAAFGVFMHSPPSILDGLTGATPKAKRAAQMAAPLEGNYLFCINPALEPFSDADFRNDLKAFVSGETEVLSDAGLPHMTLSVCETDYPLLCYATALCERLTAAGADVTLKQYSETIAAYPFMLNLLIRDFPPHSSDTPLVRRSESSLHSQAGHCR